MWQKIKSYIIPIAIPLLVGGLSSYLIRDNINIYSQIQKPPLAPHPLVFPIAWTILYALMGYSSGRIYQQRKESPDLVLDALLAYAIQLIVNFFWSILFFNMQDFLLSFIWLVFLWVLIVIMIYRFYKVDPIAALLQIPYLLWVTFAGYLNLAIYYLN